MKVRDLCEEVENKEDTTFPKDKKVKLRNKLKDMWDIIDRYEKSGDIHKDDKQRVDTFKDFISDMVKDDGDV